MSNTNNLVPYVPATPYSTKFYVISEEEIKTYCPRKIYGPFFNRLSQVMIHVSRGRQSAKLPKVEPRLVICKDWPMWDTVSVELMKLRAEENTIKDTDLQEFRKKFHDLIDQMLEGL